MVVGIREKEVHEHHHSMNEVCFEGSSLSQGRYYVLYCVLSSKLLAGEVAALAIDKLKGAQ